MKVKLNRIDEEIFTKENLSWYLGVDTFKFSDNQYMNFSLESQKKWISETNKCEHTMLLGIFIENKYIGNFQFSDIKSNHNRAEISYMIGDSNYWGKGIMTFVIKEAIKISTTKLNLNKLYAGLAHENHGSKRVLEKNGFLQEGVKKKHLFFNGKWYDQLDYGLLL